MKRLLPVIFFLSLSGSLLAQTGLIKGVVFTSDGKPAEFINVGLKGTAYGHVTDKEGHYELRNIPYGTYTLVGSFVGLEPREQQLVVNRAEAVTIDINLKESSTQLNEVVVTGNGTLNMRHAEIGKIGIRPLDLPQSVATLNRDLLERQQTLRLSDVLKNTNGVYLMGTTGGYQEEIAGRGFAYTNSNTFKNGVRFNNTAMPEMSSLERVEVMKGSTAILFGNVAPGGIINLVTKKPLFEKGGEVAMRMGSYGLYKPSVDVYGPLNERKSAAFRLGTSYENAGSFRDNVNGTRVYINPSFLMKAGKRTDVLVEGDFLEDNRTCDFGVGAINYELISIPRSRFIGVSWSYYKAVQKSATATITHHLNSSWQLRSVTSYQYLSNDLFANQRPNGNNQFIKANGDWIRGLQRTKVKDEYMITQLDLTGRFTIAGMDHILLVGADADRYETGTTAYNPLNRYDSINVFDPAKYTPRNDVPDLTMRTLTSAPIRRAGAYVQDLVSVSRKLKVLVGARFSYLETFSDVYTYSTKTTLATRQYDKAISPRVGIVYQPVKTSSVFLSYSNSFTPNSGVDVLGKALPPSMFEQYEAGIKNELFKGLLSLNITAYQLINTNLAQTSLANGNTNTNIKELAGEVTSNGLEVDLMSKPWNGISIVGGYSYNDTRYTRSNTYIDGSKLRYNPNHTGNLSVYYQVRNTTWLNGFNMGAGALYIGQRWAGRSTRLTVANDSYRLIPLPAYTSVELSAGYTKSNYTVRVKVSNLLNELSYNVHDDNSVNPIAPRQFVATISYRF